MEKIARLFAILFFLSSLLLMFSGYKYSGTRGQQISVPHIPIVNGWSESIAKTTTSLIRKNGLIKKTQFRTMGLLVPLGGIGGALLLISIYAFYISAKLAAAAREKEIHRISWGDNQFVHAHTDGGKPISASSRYRMEIDESLLQHQPLSEEEKIFESLANVIALGQSKLEDTKIRAIFNVLRPDILKGIDLCTPVAIEKIAKQVLAHYVLTQKRAEKNMSADQFRLQDERTNELARETIARRFIPLRPEQVPPNMADSIGKIYDLSEQAEIQQKAAFGQIEDWQDISLRNITSVMEAPLHNTTSPQPQHEPLVSDQS